MCLVLQNCSIMWSDLFLNAFVYIYYRGFIYRARCLYYCLIYGPVCMLLSTCQFKQLLHPENLTEELIQVAYLHKCGVVDEHRRNPRLYTKKLCQCLLFLFIYYLFFLLLSSCSSCKNGHILSNRLLNIFIAI